MTSLEKISFENYVKDPKEKEKYELFKYIFERADDALHKIRALYLKSIPRIFIRL